MRAEQLIPGSLFSRIAEWVGVLLPEATITSAPPSSVERPLSGHQISLYPLAINPVAFMPGRTHSPLQIEVCYLVTTWAENDAAAHEVMAELALAILQPDRQPWPSVPPWQVDLTPPPLEMWSGFGIPPRPAFFLRLPVTTGPARERVPFVHKVILSMDTGHELRGVVSTTDGTPVPSAVVEIPALSLSAACDHHGRFQFQNLPSRLPQTLLVRARGRVSSFSVPAARSAEGGIALTVTLSEEA